MTGMQVRAGTGVRWLLIVGLCALFGMVVAAPVRAHAELVSSTPADGASLKLAPKVVRLVFGEDLLPGGTAVTATDVAADGRVELPDPQVAGDTVSVRWPASAPGGQYRVAYRVVSADGHPITGSISFRYAQARITASDVSQQVQPLPDGSASQSQPAEALGPTPEKDPISSPALAGALVLGIVALGAVGFGTWHTSRRR
jgi:methionine-rich copper-binding protein CopC